MSDAQIIDVIDAMIVAEIDQAKLVYARSKTESLRQLADTMIDDSEGQKRKRDRAGMKRASSRLSETYRDDAVKRLAGLEGVKRNEFDDAYLHTQIDAEVQALAIIDTALLPRSVDTDLRTYVSGFRADVQRHLDLARRVENAAERPKVREVPAHPARRRAPGLT